MCRGSGVNNREITAVAFFIVCQCNCSRVVTHARHYRLVVLPSVPDWCYVNTTEGVIRQWMLDCGLKSRVFTRRRCWWNSSWIAPASIPNKATTAHTQSV